MSEKALALSELPEFCKQLANDLKAPQVVLLNGPLGAGKTQLVQQLINTLGGDAVSSPTYSLINEYQTSQFPIIYHIDLYRLKDDEDLESTGFWDLFSDKNALIFIEWANKLNQSELPLDWPQLCIDIALADDKRTYRVQSS